MAQTKLFGKDLSAYDSINIDELLLTLTEEEIEELGQDLIDPDVSKTNDCKHHGTWCSIHKSISG